MRLRRLSLFGFKSFATKTTLEFCDGLSVIVGANGSGKSNIADAIWWVLGQQNPRLLRVNRADELIFSGSSTRPPLSVAEVSLVLERGGEEVELTRRVARDGENEYFINGDRCRLKDIWNLVSEANAYPDGFAIMCQGRTDEFVSMSAEERKGLLEQVAGVARYRLRRDEALRQLSEGEKRLERITDLKAELECRKAELADAAEKARKCRELTTRLQSLEAGAALDDFCVLKEAIEKVRAEADAGRQRLDQVEIELAHVEAEIEEIGREKEKVEAELKETEATLRVKSERLSQLNVEVPLAEQHVSALEREANRLRVESKGDSERATGLEDEASQEAERAEGLAAEARQKEEQAERLERDDIPQLTRARDGKAAQLEAARDDLFELLNENATLRNNLMRVKGDLERLKKQVSRWQHEILHVEASEKELGERESLLTTTRDGLISQIEKYKADLSELETGAKELEARRKAIETSRAPIVAELAKVNSRRAVLEELCHSYEEFAPGVRAVLKAATEGRLSGLRGAIGQMIQVERGFELAVDVALGGALQYIIADDVSSAKQAIQFLKRENAGRVTFLPRDTVRPFDFSKHELMMIRQFEGVCPLCGVIKIAPEFENCLRNVAGRVAVAPDVETALKLGRKCGFTFRIATVTGELFNPGGSLTGGKPKQAGLMQRRAEISELEAEGARLKQELDLLESRAEKVDAELSRLTSRAKGCRDAMTRASIELSSIETELKQVGLSRSRLVTALADLKADVERSVAEMDKLRKEAERLSTELGEGESREVQLRAGIRDAEGEYEMARKAVEERSLASKSLKAEASSLRREAASILERRDRLIEEARRLRSVAAEKSAAAESMAVQRLDMIRKLELAKAELMGLRDETGGLSQKEADLQKHLQELEVRIEEANRTYRSLRVTHGKAAASLQAAELDIARREAEARSLEEKIREVPPGTQRVARELVADEIEKLQEEIRGLGPVNPLAETEYRELCERISTMDAQIEDINGAKADLYKLIEKIDAEMRRRYLVTADAVRREFRRTFVELFEGGEGDLIVTEAGIELSARPPGRKMKGLASLSGGEKAMTGIAALFAMARVNPSPFYVLDEVDAALDDVNLARFLRYLTSASAKTQFIVITHQRQLMQAAHALYGVTTDEPGVSRIVSVKLREVSAV